MNFCQRIQVFVAVQLSLCVVPLAATAAPTLTELRQRAFPLVKKYCVGCHQPYSQSQEVERSAGRLLRRLDLNLPNGMPLAGSSQRTELERKQGDLLSMREYLELASKLDAPVMPALPLQKIKLPPGFKISIFAAAPGARSMALSPAGTLFVGTGGLSGNFNRVYAIRDLDGDGVGENVTIIADGLNTPNGVAFKNGDLYVAEISRILVFRGIERRIASNASFEVFNDSFPSDGHHGWKFIRFAPDGSLFVPVGAPCNNCVREPTHAALFKLSADGKTKTLVAQGIRNTVGFDFHPLTGDLVFTDNGRDQLGDNMPPCELNRLAKSDWLQPGVKPRHFGFPYCHSGRIADPEFGSRRACREFEAPVLEFGAHVAPLGARFYTGTRFPVEYRHQVFVAEHGSWNRTKPQGYRVSLGWSDDGGRSFQYKIFASGWLNADDTRWGRPVDVEVALDGSLLISDDMAGVIYRISY